MNDIGYSQKIRDFTAGSLVDPAEVALFQMLQKRPPVIEHGGLEGGGLNRSFGK